MHLDFDAKFMNLPHCVLLVFGYCICCVLLGTRDPRTRGQTLKNTPLPCHDQCPDCVWSLRIFLLYLVCYDFHRTNHTCLGGRHDHKKKRGGHTIRARENTWILPNSKIKKIKRSLNCAWRKRGGQTLIIHDSKTSAHPPPPSTV